MIPMYRPYSIQEMRKDRSKCKDDNGERTNTKLYDQPFFQRARNGKPKRY